MHSSPVSKTEKILDLKDLAEIGKLVREKGTVPMRAPGAVPHSIDRSGITVFKQSEGVETKWVEITPAMATNWLKNNFGNRPMKEDVVKAYARDMINKVWFATHQGIAFNDLDALIDGQHRLAAIVMSGVTVRMMVTFGLPSRVEGHAMTTMDAVDRGATRSVADQLTIQHGLKNSGVTSQICNSLSSLCLGDRARRLSVAQTLDVFHSFEKAIEYVITHRSKQAGLKSAGVLAGFAFALTTEENFWERETPIASLFRKLNTGEEIEKFHATKLLRTFLTGEENKLFMPSLNRGLAELTLQAIYLELKNAAPAVLEMSIDGTNHFRSLQPERVEKIAALFKLPTKTTTKTIIKHLHDEAKPKAKPTLDAIFKKAEITFGIAGLIIAGRGSDKHIDFVRAAIATIANDYGYPVADVSRLLKRDAKKCADKLPELLRSNDGTVFKSQFSYFQKSFK